MSDFELEINVDHHDLDLVMERVQMALADEQISAFMEEIVIPYEHHRIEDRFAHEGDELTGPWAQLRDATIAIREAKGYSAGPINQRSGEMLQFLTSNSELRESGGGIVTATIPGTDIAGEMLDKIMTAQLGRKTPSTKPRPVLAIGPKDIAAIVTGFRTWITEHIAA